MSEKLRWPERLEETVEQKKERLMPVFLDSMEAWMDSERDWHEGFLIVTRKRSNGELETIDELMLMEMTEDGPNLARVIDLDGEPEPGASATMLWGELVDAKPMIKRDLN